MLYEKKDAESQKLETKFKLAKADLQQVFQEGVRFGRKLGRLEAITQQVISQGRQLSYLFQTRKVRKREDENPVYETTYPYFNQWWNNLKSSYNIRLPPIRGSRVDPRARA